MNCDTIVHRHPARWVEESVPLLLWELGPHTVVQHWVNVLFDSKGKLILWLEEADPLLVAFLNATFPLSERSEVRLGPPPGIAGDASTCIEESGKISIRLGEVARRYIPDQDPLKTWFSMLKKWLLDLQNKGSAAPEIERELQPGVFVSDHCWVSPQAVFHPPCWIGSRTDIGHCVIGPNATVGANCIVAHGARIAESSVLSNTYIGAGFVLDGLVAGNNRVIQHQTGVMTRVDDKLLMRRLRK